MNISLTYIAKLIYLCKLNIHIDGTNKKMP